MNSKVKGNRGEVELANILREYGYNARRGLQYQSGQIEADVVGVPGIHIECKRVEKLNLYNAMAQSIRDAKDEEKPVVAHRTNRHPWLVTMLLEDWLALLGGKNGK